MATPVAGKMGVAQLILMRSPECFQRPNILGFIVAEYVKVPVIGTHAEICCIRRIPLVIQFRNIERSAVKSKLHWALVGAITRVALHLNFAHQMPPGLHLP
jgi:hypothetical protein